MRHAVGILPLANATDLWRKPIPARLGSRWGLRPRHGGTRPARPEIITGLCLQGPELFFILLLPLPHEWRTMQKYQILASLANEEMARAATNPEVFP
jgi:hypothetical protein